MRVIQRTVVLVFAITQRLTFLDRTFETVFTLEDPESERFFNCLNHVLKGLKSYQTKSKNWISPNEVIFM